MQVLNVSRGGTLFQHLPDLPSATISHRQDEPGDQPTHRVGLEPSSLAARLLGGSEIPVNTFHHQGLDRLGEGIEATGWADDGLVEAVEIPDRHFALGVQWHAELMVEGQAGPPLFSRLVETAREYARSRGVRA
jgi:putative glutamine amidotransferase